VDRITKRVHERIILPVLLADHEEFPHRFHASVVPYQNHVVALALYVLSYDKRMKFIERLERLELDSHEILLEAVKKNDIFDEESQNATYALQAMVEWERFVVKKIRSKDFAKSFTVPEYIDLFEDLMPLALAVQCMVTCTILNIVDGNARLNFRELAKIGVEYATKVKPLINSLGAQFGNSQ